MKVFTIIIIMHVFECFGVYICIIPSCRIETVYVSGSSKIQTLLPSNKLRYFSTELQNLKPCGEISITL